MNSAPSAGPTCPHVARGSKLVRKLLMFLRWWIGWHSIYNLTTCNISQELWEAHDYKVHKGGDGVPNCWYVYTCPACGKDFQI